jgi:hypothetical protein
VKAAAKSKAWPKVDKVVKVKVGTTLNAIKGTWTGIPTPQITYQWYVCSQKVARATQSIPSNCKSVRLQTRTKFRLTSAHKGKYITVRVIGKSGGTSNTVWLAISTDKVI